MKKALIILLILVQVSCSTYTSKMNSNGEKASGIILDGESNEPMIGFNIVELGNYENGTHTDLNGKFELEFKGSKPIIELSGFYEIILCELELGKENTIKIDAKLFKKSKRLRNQLKRTR